MFALGAMLAGLGGAIQLPREPASLMLDLRAIGEAFVIVVVGGMGSIPGAYVAALLIAEIKAICIGLGTTTLFGITISFKKAGIDITGILTSGGGGTTVRNILASKLPYGEVAVSAALAAQRQGLDVVIVNTGTRSVAEATLVTLPDSPVKLSLIHI